MRLPPAVWMALYGSGMWKQEHVSGLCVAIVLQYSVLRFRLKEIRLVLEVATKQYGYGMWRQEIANTS
jgi:hypothetical protein